MSTDSLVYDAEAPKDCVVALYDFDPSSIDWPFRRQRPLPLRTGLVISVIHDDGSDWIYGCPVNQPKLRGYFPKNYTVSKKTYEDLAEDYEKAQEEAQRQRDEEDEIPEPPETSSLPEVLPDPTSLAPIAQPEDDDIPELQIPGIASYPILHPAPPIATTYEVNKARLLINPPPVPRQHLSEAAPPADAIDRALLEVQKELTRDSHEPRRLPGGELSDSRASTPVTRHLTRPDRDFVRHNLPSKFKDHRTEKLANMAELFMRHVRQARESRPAYPVDLRIRSTTCRLAGGIEPTLMKAALAEASQSQARWHQMFRPQFNDLVNESYKVACNACILSRGYVENEVIKEQFQRLHTMDTGGTMWFDLKRRKEHLFYMRTENKDVMMCHPDAWGLPDANQFIKVTAGSSYNPAHGWLCQTSIDPDKEMEDVEFLYTIRLRTFPEKIFRNIGMGKLPAWIEPYSVLKGEASLEEDQELEDTGAGGKAGANLLNEAGMDAVDDECFVKMDELRLARERTIGPDIMDSRTEAYRITGLTAMRIFLRSYGRPDQTKLTQLTPKIVKDMAAQLGIKGEFKEYWYCMFALRYPLALEWEVIIRNDTRWYLHLPSNRMQPIHPMVRAFRAHMNDYIENDFLWDFRGFVRMKCGECGVPDAVLWCMQCTDYFCTKCFHATHKTERGKKHWLMPVPGCRYLDRKEVDRLQEYVPLLNVGFSNRRRFLAIDNQSDKHGPRFGDPWLCFPADTFQAALVQCPKEHWHVKRTTPPRLAPGQKEYYYNFEHDILADDQCYIMDAALEQKAVATLQKCFRGALTRRRIKRETEAVVTIQKTRIMWNVQKVYGDTGRNASILKGWYMKYAARKGRQRYELLVAGVQAVARGMWDRRFVIKKMQVVTKLQASYRRKLQQRIIHVKGRGHTVRCRRLGCSVPTFTGMRSQINVQVFVPNYSGRLHRAALVIQKALRGYLHGRRIMQLRRTSACKIAAVGKGVSLRRVLRRRQEVAAYIQAHWRGLRGRQRVRLMHSAALRIQRNVRRFSALIHVKHLIFARMHEMEKKRAIVLFGKLQLSAVEMIQRNYRRYVHYQKYLYLRQEKGDSDKRTQTLIVALFTAAGALRHHVHPWWRHLPPTIQDILEQMKIPLQRTISNVPVRGKLANEEIGRRGLRTAHVDNLTYKTPDDSPDIASHMLLCITRHLLSLVPAELFPGTVKWACYAISHKAVELSCKGALKKTVIPVGKEMPPHPGDSLATLWDDTSCCKSEIESFLKVPDVSLPMTVLHTLSPHHRQVFLTANILIIMRQALDAPSLSTDDHLRFQGLDAAAGAQLMEVFGSELDHPVPLDWPKALGTVSSLAVKTASIVTELQPETISGHGNPSITRRPRGEKGKIAQLEPQKEPHKEPHHKEPHKESHKTEKHGKPPLPKESGKHHGVAKSPGGKGKHVKAKPHKKRTDVIPVDELGHLAHFNRNALARILQQLGYYMRDQTAIVNTILAGEEGIRLDNKARGVRTSRYISVTERMFDIADNAKHDHCSFVLAVVLFHMVIRGIMLRLTYHRAAVVVQKRYRYLKSAGKKFANLPHAVTIQRFWRGLRAALHTMRKINAARMIARNYKIICQKRHAAKLIRAIVLIQRYARSRVTRIWLQHCHDAATFVQKFVRGLLVRVVLDKSGRDIMRRYQKQMNFLLRMKDSRSETEHIARCSALSGKVTNEMVKHRNRNIDMRRALSFNVRAKHTRQRDREAMIAKVGRVQPQRSSVFEPMASGREELFAVFNPLVALDLMSHGCKRSRVLDLVKNAHDVIDRSSETALPAGATSAGTKWRCFHLSAEKGGTCKEVNDSGTIFCISCGKKRYGLLHAAAARGHAAIVARRKAKSGKSYVSNSKLFDSKLCGSWRKRCFEVGVA